MDMIYGADSNSKTVIAKWILDTKRFISANRKTSGLHQKKQNK